MSIAKPFAFCSQHNQHQSDHWTTICDCEFLKWVLSHQNITLCSSLGKLSNQSNQTIGYIFVVDCPRGIIPSRACQQFWSGSLVFFQRGMGQEWAKIVFLTKKRFFFLKKSIFIEFGLGTCEIVCSLPAMLPCYWGLCHRLGWSPPFLTQQEYLRYVFRVFFYEINKAGLGTLSTTYIFYSHCKCSSSDQCFT